MKAKELRVVDIYLYSATKKVCLPFFSHDDYSRKIVGFYVGYDMKVSNEAMVHKKALA